MLNTDGWALHLEFPIEGDRDGKQVPRQWLLVASTLWEQLASIVDSETIELRLSFSVAVIMILNETESVYQPVSGKSKS